MRRTELRFGIAPWVVGILIGTATGLPAGEEQSARHFAMGFTPFPWDISIEAVAATDAYITKNGDIVAHHFDNGIP